MRTQSGLIAVALVLLLLLTAPSSAADAETESSASPLPPGDDQPRRVVKRASPFRTKLM